MSVNKVLYNIDQRTETTENDKARARANMAFICEMMGDASRREK